MEITLGHIITIAVFAIGFIINYFAITVRNDQKTLHLEDRLKNHEIEFTKIGSVLDQHKSNAEIHFSLAVSNQVQKRTDEKFSEIEKQLTKMESGFGDKFRELKEMFKAQAAK